MVFVYHKLWKFGSVLSKIVPKYFRAFNFSHWVCPKDVEHSKGPPHSFIPITSEHMNLSSNNTAKRRSCKGKITSSEGSLDRRDTSHLGLRIRNESGCKRRWWRLKCKGHKLSCLQGMSSTGISSLSQWDKYNPDSRIRPWWSVKFELFTTVCFNVLLGAIRP